MTTPIPLPVFHRNPACEECDLHRHARSPCIPTIHLKDSLPPTPTTDAVVFLGQNPGFHEDEACVPFIGKSGSLLRDVMIPGISLTSLASIYFTNTARCYTPADSPPKDRHYKLCSSLYLPQDLAWICTLHLSARVLLVALGAPAAKWLTHYFTGEKPTQKSCFTSQARPVTLPSFPFTCHLFATYHPAAVLRDHNLLHVVHDHLQIISDFLTGNAPTPSKPRIVPTSFPPKGNPCPVLSSPSAKS